MGLLDDAIREHLELKRRHGADPDEVARQEREAFGPGQRNEFAQPADVDAPPAAAPGYDEDPWLEEDEADEVPADEALESRPPTGEEDVLEETPEFLQETPEHDRLWFEQKPPRDFDWDK